MSVLKNSKHITVPKATKKPYELTLHGDSRIDPYFWMRLSDEQKNAETPDPHTQEVTAYLEEENRYKETMMAPLKDFEDQLFQEIIGRIKQSDMSVPFLENGFYYLHRFEEGKEYPIISRKPDLDQDDEELLLDVNQLAEPYAYYQLRKYGSSPNNNLLAYSEDTVSRRQYTIRVKDLETGELLPDVIPNTEGSIVWSEDNSCIFYTVRDESLRPYKIFRHKLGTPVEEDVEVYHETDGKFICYIYKSKSRQFIIIGSYATNSREFRFIPAATPDAAFRVFSARKDKHEYQIDHVDRQWYIISNLDGAKNFKLLKTDLSNTESAHWKELIRHREDVLLEGMEMFQDRMVLMERKQGLTMLRVISWDGEDYYIQFEEEAYMVFPSTNKEMNSSILRYSYTSMTTPISTIDFDFNTKEKILLKQKEVVGDFNSANYHAERMMISARDGKNVPISLVYRKGFKRDGKAPLLLYAYGSYGHSMDPYFSSNRLSLLDRGFVFAIAHIRGGQELGRAWYEEGKMLNKKNTFTDFIDCGEFLIKEGYTSKDGLFAMGGSAGGLLMGAIMNIRPDLWAGVIAAVPFVDVLSTMMDETIPLTIGEYDEWGNPNDLQYYEYIKSYSPYDNVDKKEYPALMVTTGLHDSQVQYWEPAKWVAKLRELKTDDNPLLLHCNMETGHSGASGRFKVHRETAMEYTFILDLAGLVENV